MIAAIGEPAAAAKYDASVKGMITFDGKPLPRGTVKFVPTQSGPAAYGLVADDGSYSIMTGREKGLPPGDYTVTVVANEPSVPGSNPSLPPAPGKPITPPWFRDQTKSPLKYNDQTRQERNQLGSDINAAPGIQDGEAEVVRSQLGN